MEKKKNRNVSKRFRMKLFYILVMNTFWDLRIIESRDIKTKVIIVKLV